VMRWRTGSVSRAIVTPPPTLSRSRITVGLRVTRRSALRLLAALRFTGIMSQGAGAHLGGLVNGEPRISG
jgi:hypothetical protein